MAKVRTSVGLVTTAAYLLACGLCCPRCFPSLPPVTDPTHVVHAQPGEIIEITTRWNTFGAQAIPAEPSALAADYDPELLEYVDMTVVTEPTVPVSGRSTSRFTLRLRALQPGVTMVAIEAVEFYAGPPEPRTVYFTVAIGQSPYATLTPFPTPTTTPTAEPTPRATDPGG